MHFFDETMSVPKKCVSMIIQSLMTDMWFILANIVNNGLKFELIFLEKNEHA